MHRQVNALRPEIRRPADELLRGEAELGDDAQLGIAALAECLLQAQGFQGGVGVEVGRAFRMPGDADLPDPGGIKGAGLQYFKAGGEVACRALQAAADDQHINHAGLGGQALDAAGQGRPAAEPAGGEMRHRAIAKRRQSRGGGDHLRVADIAGIGQIHPGIGGE